MLEGVRSYVWGQLKAAKPAFVSKKPHFSFITVHYFWIIGATIVCSVAMFIAGKGELAYIDALMFASGANTQAGLNPVDVNLLNGFQQAMIYLFSMTSNPITMHACVVFLRLYWFEKRFRSWAREVRQRRRTLTKPKSQARNDMHMAEQGVNGRNITLVPQNGRKQRITNDGILLEDGDNHQSRPAGVHKSDESDTTTTTAAEEQSQPADPIVLETPAEKGQGQAGGGGRRGSRSSAHNLAGHTAITFADTVKRSDGLDDDPTNFSQSQHRSHAEHIAIVERQRNPDDDEVLRIPGPRDAERGLGPRRLQADDVHEDDETQAQLNRSPTADSKFGGVGTDPGRIRERQSTIVITEPEKHHRDELEDNVKAVGGTLDALRFRKPRIFNRSQNKFHEDSEDPRPVRAVRTRTLDTIRSALSNSKTDDMPYLSYTPTMGRNSNFVGLTLEQREELGGIEYRSLRTLAIVLLSYFWGFHLVVLVCLLPLILHNDHYGKIVEADGISRTWWGFFTSNVAFMDVGFTLTPDSMISFNTSEFTLMVCWFFILIGNTAFPVMLRFLIWLCAKLAPVGSGIWEELRFLLDHPRRCFTLLFPSGPNWWLFWILVVLNALDLLFFMVLDLGSEPIAQFSVKNRVVIGLFQAASTRTAGFSAVSMSDLHPAIPVLYLIMMYISVFPIAISIRRTNVYEEKSLGMYQKHDIEDDQDVPALSYVGTHLRRQLSFDLWYVFLGFFIITISEGPKIVANRFSLFDILFEVVSAYGTVGLSMGAKGVNASLCSQFTVVGKLVIVAMEIRGRHRGLPYGLDRAILLPSEEKFKREAEEQEAALARTNTAMSHATASGFQRQGTNMSRTRSKSRERGRVNGSVVRSFLHPGPVVPRDGPSHHQRISSTDTQGTPLSPMRTYTESHLSHRNDDTVELGPISSTGSSRPRQGRADTTPVF
ncbi:low affinity potassium transporter [Conoideocrella luteorostrata]|uniref:Potassium transport protein n=1 Tax=Conoideocrella luteorostrata TaxID=1105319 RepID=A0AAJ0FU83_9HYPO|nr:low affinity potassium transporter [Conoideocrella luteorostrata]